MVALKECFEMFDIIEKEALRQAVGPPEASILVMDYPIEEVEYGMAEREE